MPYPLRQDTAPRAEWPAGLTHLENGMIVGAQAQYEAENFAPSDEPTAEELALENMDTFSDWLVGQCAQHRRVAVPIMRSGVGAMEAAVEACTVPQLVVLTLDGRSDVRAFAATTLKDRYLAEVLK